MKKKQKREEQKNTIQGECIPTNFAWLTLEQQKKNAEKLANIGKKKDKKKF